MRIKKILTHDEVFHADEVFAIALIQAVFNSNIKVVRTRDITTDDMSDPEIWVLDQGKEYNPELHNFDHHQDQSLESTNVLVLEYLLEEGYILQDLYERLIKSFKAISNIDRNGFNGVEDYFHVNSLIKSYNSLYDGSMYLNTGFECALHCAKMYVIANQKFVNNHIQWKESYKDAYCLNKTCRELLATDLFPVNWKEYATHPFLLETIEKDGVTKWKLHSYDSEEYPIQATGKEDFIHVNKFIAVYTNKEDVLESLRKQDAHYMDKPLKIKADEKQLLDKV